MKKIKFISFVGTRPEIIRVLRGLKDHLIVDTGQHWDANMDDNFWKENNWKPDVNMNARSFGEIYEQACAVIDRFKPKIVITYGDTRSSMVCSLAAKDSGSKLAHLEAGVRCKNLEMPEERNRRIIDSIADYLFAINDLGKRNLINESVPGEIFVVGDLLFDRFLEKRTHQDYIFMTIHRQENQNTKVLEALFKEYRGRKIIFPVHPVMKKFFKPKFFRLPGINLFKPQSHQWTLDKIKNAALVVTDSGGVMREAFFSGVPLKSILKDNPLEKEITIFGDGHAEDKIKEILLRL